MLGAIPEMFLKVWSSLTESLDIQAGQTLLVRGGTSSIGLTSVAVAKNAGLTVLATTRSEKKKQALLDAGADHVLIDDGNIAEKVRTIFPRWEWIAFKNWLGRAHCLIPCKPRHQ